MDRDLALNIIKEFKEVLFDLSEIKNKINICNSYPDLHIFTVDEFMEFCQALELDYTKEYSVTHEATFYYTYFENVKIITVDKGWEKIRE